MKEYVPDWDKWARYFERVAEKTEKGQVVRIDGSRPTRRIIPIEDPEKKPPRPKEYPIVAVTPVERMNEQIKSEIRRLKALASGKRKPQRGGGRGARSRLKRVGSRDTSGF